MINIVQANYQDPHSSPACNFSISFVAEPTPAGDMAIDNAIEFVQRVKLLVDASANASAPLAKGADGLLLTAAEFQRAIEDARASGHEAARMNQATTRSNKAASRRRRAKKTKVRNRRK